MKSPLSLPGKHQNALREAESELVQRKYSQRTIKSYRSHLALFLAFFAEKKIKGNFYSDFP